jgi:hypothetical protein
MIFSIPSLFLNLCLASHFSIAVILYLVRRADLVLKLFVSGHTLSLGLVNLLLVPVQVRVVGEV